MIENYKGWDITLNWKDNKLLKIPSNDVDSYNQKKKWVGVDILGHRIYGSSLNEIRRLIDYSISYKS